jgi:TPR repeat protein
MANLTFQPSPPPSFPQPPPPAIPSLTAPLPILSQLQSAANAIQSPSHDPALKVAWCRDVFFLIDRANQEFIPGADPPVGPLSITDPTLSRLAQIAVPLILQLSQTYNPSQGNKIAPFIAEAISMRATLAATGAFPDYVRLNPRNAFRDFESAARGGYSAAWFRLGRDYENFNDHQHARDCFERGVRLNVESCLYRMGMAHLLGQLSLPQNITVALPLLQRAATLATLQVPQPAYVYSLLLLSEFTQITVPPALFAPLIPPLSSPTLEARKHLERAAFLHFPAAQYKLGHAYEFAEAPFPFDPLLSVQYYSLASEQGESEADMALSKWFLCGSNGAAGGQGGVGGGFEKDEALALTFADKAAKKGLPSAEFAMGYYAEVGVGRPKDIKTATEWYQLVRSRFFFIFHHLTHLFRLTSTVTRMPHCGSRPY